MMADRTDLEDLNYPPGELCPHAGSLLEGLKEGAKAMAKCPVCPVELYREFKKGSAPASKGETKPQK